jgi:hypothetical protein
MELLLVYAEEELTDPLLEPVCADAAAVNTARSDIASRGENLIMSSSLSS